MVDSQIRQTRPTPSIGALWEHNRTAYSPYKSAAMIIAVLFRFMKICWDGSQDLLRWFPRFRLDGSQDLLRWFPRFRWDGSQDSAKMVPKICWDGSQDSVEMVPKIPLRWCPRFRWDGSQDLLRWFPRFQVATTCFSCSPPDLNLLVTNFIFCIHIK